jgi:aminoglycoside phosphotransferase (APT) family kinase protein
MTEPANENLGTTAIRAGFEFNHAAIERWLTQQVPHYAGPLRIEQFKGGQSNPTYKLVTPSRSYVLRRKPPGLSLKGAHAVDREARVLSGVAQSGLPVPIVYGLCMDESVIGTPFYVMEMVEGRIFWDASLQPLPRDERAPIFDAMNATIAQLHMIDPSQVGLGDYGRTGNYFERQIGRWSRQYFDDQMAGRDPLMDRLIEWLQTNTPADDEATIIHGDYRIDNLIFHPEQPHVVAVLDWELSTLGHPGADFAYNAMMYRMPPHIVAGLGGSNPEAMGLPSEVEYLAAYCRRVRKDSLPHYGFYIAFNFFRIAAIFHGIKGRMLRGTAASAQARERVRILPELMQLAWAQAERADEGAGS